jgi:hypothetical protein
MNKVIKKVRKMLVIVEELLSDSNSSEVYFIGESSSNHAFYALGS